MMPLRINRMSAMSCRAVLALTILFSIGQYANAQRAATVGAASDAGPFGELAGSWSGSGTIDLSKDRHEPIRCRASYDVLEEVGSSRVDLQACKLEYSIVSPK